MRKTNVRQHSRQNKHVNANVRNHQRNLPTRPVLGTIALKNLTYPQAKKTFPKLKPRGDIDGDGVINKRDCRPFDVSRQDDVRSRTDEEAYKEDESWRENSRGFTDEEENEIASDIARENEELIKAEQEELARQAARELEERRIEEEQREADENLSNAIARREQKERGWLW